MIHDDWLLENFLFHSYVKEPDCISNGHSSLLWRCWSFQELQGLVWYHLLDVWARRCWNLQEVIVRAAVAARCRSPNGIIIGNLWKLILGLGEKSNQQIRWENDGDRSAVTITIWDARKFCQGNAEYGWNLQSEGITLPEAYHPPTLAKLWKAPYTVRGWCWIAIMCSAYKKRD